MYIRFAPIGTLIALPTLAGHNQSILFYPALRISFYAPLRI